MLRAIKRLLYDHGFTIKGVQKMLREQGAQAVIRGAEAPPVAFPNLRHACRSSSRPWPSRRAYRARLQFPNDPAQAAEIRRSGSSGEDIATLRTLLKELREAERILAQARAN